MEAWLERDLKQANMNRQSVPWIIVTGHVPLYCVASDCDTYATLYSAIDTLVYKYGVDVYLGAHKHQYQFLKPIYNK